MQGQHESPAEPLNVQVARALGWTVFRNDQVIGRKPGPDGPVEIRRQRWVRVVQGGEILDADDWWQVDEAGSSGSVVVREIDPYGDDTPGGWACTGPMIARYGITLVEGTAYDGSVEWIAGEYGGGWWPDSDALDGQLLNHVTATTPCEAIARLIVRLGASGGLPK